MGQFPAADRRQSGKTGRRPALPIGRFEFGAAIACCLTGEGERLDEIALIGGIQRHIGIEAGPRIDAGQSLDGGCRPPEEAGGFVEASLVADLQRKFHKRQTNLSGIGSKEPCIDIEGVAKSRFRSGEIVGAAIDSRKLHILRVGDGIYGARHQHIVGEPCRKEALAGGNLGGRHRVARSGGDCCRQHGKHARQTFGLIEGPI